MRFLRQSLMGLFLLSATVGVLVYAAYLVQASVQERLAREARAPGGRERAFAVNVLRAHSATVTPVMTVFGEIKSRRTLDIRPAAGGTVVELSPDFVEGGHVAKGQLLLRTDPADAQSALDRAEADLLDAKAETRDAARALELARDELAAAEEQSALRDRAFQRQRDLKARGVGTEAAVETAELAASSARQAVLSRRQALTQAQARVDQAATRLVRSELTRDEAGRHLADTEIRAEFTGTLSGVTLVQGGLVSANERLAQLVDRDALEVAFRVSTQQFLRLLTDDGQLAQAPVTITLDVFGVDVTASGVLSRDSAAVGEGQTGRLIFARLDQARGMKPGDFVTVEINEPPLDHVVRLPASALGPAENVLVLGPNDRLEELQASLLRRQGDDVLVRGPGLSGREVVAERTPLLGAGILVRPVRQATDDVPDDTEFVELSDERRERLRTFVQAADGMPSEVKSRILDRLAQDKVPARMVERIEARMGG